MRLRRADPMHPATTVQRFEGRAKAYAAARPGYPEELADHVLRHLSLAAGTEVADVGSGTGIFTRLLLERGLRVAAVEPAGDMRRTAEGLLGGDPGFVSVNGDARSTGLPSGSVTAIFCAQAFHWFNEEATLHEWRRILRPGGSAVLIWNYHDESDAFVADFLKLVRAFGPDAAKTIAAAAAAHHDNALFRGRATETRWFSHRQPLDFASLLQRVASTSYLPRPSEPQFTAVSAALRALFDQHQVDGSVAMTYRTVAVWGKLF